MANKVKISFITTVYNEESSIGFLLESLTKQSLRANEIIIVDAGSNDSTREIILQYRKKLPIKFFTKKGNRSHGRNFAIKKAKNKIIAVSDAGCTLNNYWTEKITQPLKVSSADVVAGFYKPVANNVFEKSLASYTCVPEEKVGSDFLPSSRSIAFTKDAWSNVGGYPENLNTCEDLIFASRLKKDGFRFVVVKDAYVMWPQRRTLVSAAYQFYQYALGDGKAAYIRPTVVLLYLRYIFGMLLLILGLISQIFIYLVLILFVLYISWSIFKNYKYVANYKAIFYLPVLQLLSDFCVMTGTCLGFLTRVYSF